MKTVWRTGKGSAAGEAELKSLQRTPGKVAKEGRCVSLYGDIDLRGSGQATVEGTPTQTRGSLRKAEENII